MEASIEPDKAGYVFPASQIMLGATVAFFQGKFAAPDGRASFYKLLSQYLHQMSGHLVSAVDVLRVGLQGFPSEVSPSIPVHLSGG